MEVLVVPLEGLNPEAELLSNGLELKLVLPLALVHLNVPGLAVVLKLLLEVATKLVLGLGTK